MSNFTEWLLDVSFDYPCFVPYKDDAIVFGMNVMANKSPAKLVGVIHSEGQDAVEAWIEENPDWHEKYSGDEK